MSLSVRQTEQKLMAEIRAALDRPTLAHVVAEILIHEPAPPGSRPCWCCGSTCAQVVERVDDGELLIDRPTGRRIRPRQVKPATWARAVSLAERHEVRFRVSRAQYPLLVDDSDRHVLAAGSHRSGKTTIGLLWIARQWLRRGGRRRRFWFVAETHEKSYELVRAVFEGDGIAPPILPPELAARRPATPKAADLTTIMLDGSMWQCRRFAADPTAGSLKSRPIVAGVVDEAAEMRHANALTALKGRCIDLRGRLFLSTSPVASSFLRAEIVEPCEEWTRMPDDHPAKASGEHVGAQWISANLSLLDNPWLDPEAVRRDIAAQDHDSPSFKRDYLGLWVVGRGPLWKYDDERHTWIHEARHVRDMMPLVSARAGCSQINVTAEVVRRVFQSRPSPHYRGLRATNTAYLLGMDVNGSPQTSVAIQVTADARDPRNPDKMHLWAIDALQTWRGNALVHADMLASTAWVRQWDPSAAASPFKGCGIVIDPAALSRDPTADKWGGDPRGLAEAYGDRGFDVRAPQYRPEATGPKPLTLGRRDSHLLIHRLLAEGRLHVSQRAMPLIKAFHEQESGPDGIQPFTLSNSAGDRLASSVDALRYAAWAILHGGNPGGE